MRKIYTNFLFFLFAFFLVFFQLIQVVLAQTALKPVLRNYTSFSSKHSSTQKTGGKNSTFSVDDNSAATENLSSNATEVIEKRTLNSKYFVDKDTASKFYKLVSYGGNLHYLKNGKLLTINEKLEPLGNGFFAANAQQEPVGFDINQKTAFIETVAGKINFNNWTLYGEKGGIKTVLAAADWSRYTAGDDGLMIHDIFPGIDAEMKVQRGAIKTNFIIRRNQFPGVEKLVFEDHFNPNQNAGKLTYAAAGHQEAAFLINNKTSLNINRAIAYTEKNAAKNYVYLDYAVADNRLSFSLDAVFIDANLPSGNIIVDPLVAATATIAQADILGSMNCGSTTNYCSYKLVVPIPAKATSTDISFMFEMYAAAPSGQNQGHFAIKTVNNCSTGFYTVVNPTINTGPGYVSTNGSFYSIPALLNCWPGPSCTSQDVPFEFDFYNDYCAAGTGCSSTYVKASQPLVIKIEGYTLELASITSPVTICNGSSTILNITGQYGVPPYTYKWNTGATTASITVSPTATTAYSAVITDQCGNTITANTSVTVNPVPVIASITSNSPLCTGSQLNLSVPVVSGATYSWTGPNKFTSQNSNPILTNVTAVQSGTYTVTETVNGCVSVPLNVQVEIGMPVTPSVTIGTYVSTICAGSNVPFYANPVNGGNNPSYQWQLNGKNVGTNSSTYSSNTLADNDVLTCILTSSAGCITSSTATSNAISLKVNAYSTPSISIKANTTNTVCANTSVTFTATTVNGGDIPAYQWLLNGNPVGTNAVTYTNNTLSDQDVVSCVLTSSVVCSTSSTATSNSIKFTVMPLVAPDVLITASTTTICPGTKITFNAMPVNGGSNPVYQWKVNNINVGTNSSSYENSALNNNDVITCTITSDITCVTTTFATSKSITITVNLQVTPAIVISASATNICAGTAVNFTATPANGGNNPVYQWQLNGINSGTNSPYYSNPTPNNGDVVTCILNSDAPCSTTNLATSNTISIVVRPVLVPAVSIVASANTICSGTPVVFTASVANVGNAPVFSWMRNGSPTGTNNAVFTSAILNDGDVITCVVTPDNSGCFTVANTVSNPIVMKVNAVPVVSAGRDTVVFKGSSFRLNGSASGTISQYQWSPATYLSSTTVQNPIVTPLVTTKYTLHVISAANCEATAVVTVKVFTKIVIPNTFTPNGDGINDTWNITGLEDYPGATIEIYNRYGQQVFRAANYKQWDGTYNGKPVPLSTYYYIINPKNNMALLSGWVALVR